MRGTKARELRKAVQRTLGPFTDEKNEHRMGSRELPIPKEFRDRVFLTKGIKLPETVLVPSITITGCPHRRFYRTVKRRATRS